MMNKQKQQGQAGVIAVIIIVLVLIGGYYLWQRQQNAPMSVDFGNGIGTSPDTNNGDVTPGLPVVVSYTDTGFVPSEVTVKQGETVRFVNNGSRDVWPASAMHPTHEVYPEDVVGQCLGSSFDACRGLKLGESWDFTFNQAGSWGYHDHLGARYAGRVIVTP
jgi:plastocyanin